MDFFPLLHALALKDEVDETGKQLDELKKMVEKVLNRFEEEVSLTNQIELKGSGGWSVMKGSGNW